MLAHRRGFIAAAGAFAAAVSIIACSVIVETSSQQCDVDGDCARFGKVAACDPRSHTCVSSRELLCEQDGCLCDAGTNDDIPNLCTSAESHCYDNAKLPSGATRPAPKHAPPTVATVSATLCTGGGGGAGGTGMGGAASASISSASATSSASGSGGANGGSGGGGGADIPECSSLTPAPIYTIGPDSIKPLLSWIAESYAANTATVVYQDQSSCTAVDKAYGGGNSGATNFQYMEITDQYTTYFDGTGAEHPCKITSPIKPHIYLSDVFDTTCGYNLMGTPHGQQPLVTDFQGPVQAFGFVVPEASSQESISAEAAFDVYGFGDHSGVSPWNDRSFIYERTPDSGTQAMIAAILGIDKNFLNATPTKSSNDEAAVVGCSKEADKTIGILAADLVQEKVAAIKLLAFQAKGETCGYLPDSQRGANDKANVRDGHYAIWGPIHMMTQTSRSLPSSVTNLMKYVSGTIPPPASDDKDDIFHHWASAHLVPQCAMRVKRSKDSGDLAPFMPDSPCSCQYDAAVNGKSSCAKCTVGDSSCSTVCTPFGCEPPQP